MLFELWLYGSFLLLQDNCTPLFDAAQRGHVAVVEWLVSRGADINAKDRVKKLCFLIFFIYGSVKWYIISESKSAMISFLVG